jgi:hypothetical protein
LCGHGVLLPCGEGIVADEEKRSWCTRHGICRQVVSRLTRGLVSLYESSLGCLMQAARFARLQIFDDDLKNLRWRRHAIWHLLRRNRAKPGE